MFLRKKVRGRKWSHASPIPGAEYGSCTKITNVEPIRYLRLYVINNIEIRKKIMHDFQNKIPYQLFEVWFL